MLALRRAEHLDLWRVPPRDDVEAEAAAGNVVNGRNLLGSPHRVNGGDVKGGEDSDVLGRRRQAGGPSEGLKAPVIEVRFPAEALPPCDGHERLEPGLVCRLG